jgi:hypothetical protein
MYQVSMPAAQDIFKSIIKEVQNVTDTQETLVEKLRETFCETPNWNTMTVKTISRPWSKIGRRLIPIVERLAKVKALIMRKNGLVEDANVDIHVESSEIIHSIIVFGSKALVEDLDNVIHTKALNSIIENVMRKHQAIERAAVFLVTDALQECMLKKPESHQEAYETTLQYSVPRLEYGSASMPDLSGVIEENDNPSASIQQPSMVEESSASAFPEASVPEDGSGPTQNEENQTPSLDVEVGSEEPRMDPVPEVPEPEPEPEPEDRRTMSKNLTREILKNM